MIGQFILEKIFPFFCFEKEQSVFHKETNKCNFLRFLDQMSKPIQLFRELGRLRAFALHPVVAYISFRSMRTKYCTYQMYTPFKLHCFFPFFPSIIYYLSYYYVLFFFPLLLMYENKKSYWIWSLLHPWLQSHI